LFDTSENYLQDDGDDFITVDNSGTISLRDWQRRAKKYFFEHDNNALFTVTTGAGKTYIAIDIINDVLYNNPGTRVLIIVPKNVILESGWYKELTDYGFPIQDIGVYYGNIKEFSTITLTNMQNIHKIPLEMFQMLILDEAHNYSTPRMLEYIKHPFEYRLGLTATLSFSDGKHLELLKTFGYNTFVYDPKEALDDGILNPFDFYNIGLSLDSQSFNEYTLLSQQLTNTLKIGGGYNTLMKSNNKLKLKMLSLINERKKLVNNYEEKFEVAKQIIVNNRDKKIIVFNQFNSQTSKLYWHLLEEDVNCRVMHSGIKHSKREQDLIDFKNNKYNVLLTSKVLDEGYNLPKLDMAIIMAGDNTDKQTIQRMGRVLRKKKGITSKLYQIYCKNTIEEDASVERSKIFKALSSDYRDIHHIPGMNLDV